jgi:hypothetical protein
MDNCLRSHHFKLMKLFVLSVSDVARTIEHEQAGVLPGREAVEGVGTVLRELGRILRQHDRRQERIALRLVASMDRR